jgi:PST family polysaccharide transporter
VLTVQAIWFVVLLPALYLASNAGGLWAAGAAQFGVALLVVLPMYLYELHRTGVTLGSMWKQVSPALFGALVVAAVAVLTGRAGWPDLLVLALSGVTALATMALLGYRLRSTVRELRSAGEPAADDQHEYVPADHADHELRKT